MSELAEAFVYLWHHGPTKRYYLGKHKGTIDDGYSHSSSVMESWDDHNGRVMPKTADGSLVSLINSPVFELYNIR